MKKFDSFFTAIAIVMAVVLGYCITQWLGWVGIACIIGAGIIFGIVVISMVESIRKK